jgi:hypothetical protein
VGTVRNISPDARHVPLIDRTVEPDETVDVADELLDPAHHSWDPDVWQIETTASDSRTLAELKAEAEARGLPVSGTKSDLIARLAADNPGE